MTRKFILLLFCLSLVFCDEELQWEIESPNWTADGFFGDSLTFIHPHLLAVGARGERNGAGAVYLYRYRLPGKMWERISTIAPNANQLDSRSFGFSLSGMIRKDGAECIAIGSPSLSGSDFHRLDYPTLQRQCSVGTSMSEPRVPGTVSIYCKSQVQGGPSTKVVKEIDTKEEWDHISDIKGQIPLFGYSISWTPEGDCLAIGSPCEGGIPTDMSANGAVYLYCQHNGTGELTQRLRYNMNRVDPASMFGVSVVASERLLFAGAAHSTRLFAARRNAASQLWEEEAHPGSPGSRDTAFLSVNDPTLEASHMLGASLSATRPNSAAGMTIVVAGAPFHGRESGVAYWWRCSDFELQGDVPTPLECIPARNGFRPREAARGARFGASVTSCPESGVFAVGSPQREAEGMLAPAQGDAPMGTAARFTFYGYCSAEIQNRIIFAGGGDTVALRYTEYARDIAFFLASTQGIGSPMTRGAARAGKVTVFYQAKSLKQKRDSNELAPPPQRVAPSAAVLTSLIFATLVAIGVAGAVCYFMGRARGKQFAWIQQALSVGNAPPPRTHRE